MYTKATLVKTNSSINIAGRMGDMVLIRTDDGQFFPLDIKDISSPKICCDKCGSPVIDPTTSAAQHVCEHQSVEV